MKKMQADVVVIAAGLSGLAASIAAAEQGLSVITLEKSKTTGGAASMGMGPLAIGTKHQANVGYNLTPDDAFLKHMHWTYSGGGLLQPLHGILNCRIQRCSGRKNFKD